MNQERRVVLLAGCGNSRNNRFDTGSFEDAEVTTLDIDPDSGPTIVHDLDNFPYPFPEDYFCEIHAYDVLEHCGRQGDWVHFFHQFSEFWKILKPDGLLCATVPHWMSMWAWGDPGHTRVINEGTLVLLSQKEYKKQVGKTQMTDYRHLYKMDFDIELAEYNEDKFCFALKAIKEKS